ncbi:DUF4157 domain-containing protein [Halogeometricum borinquense]|uniref:eCIS core domain-containing protein n=1 Tax=Halogeometricum borinquense TaxID=60847 RepID=UPI00344683C7
MGFRTARENTTETERSSIWSRDETDSSRHQRQRRGPRFTAQECEDLFGIDMYMDGLEVKVQRLADSHGAGQVRQWADEGMTVDTMGKPRDMRAFRERQKERPAEVPKDIERRNAKSVQRSRGAHHEASKAGDANVPDSVRDVISSPGKQLDSSIQRVMEERMGDNLGDVRIHTGPQAAKACEDINARAFTVGNHIAFNRGEYDPNSAEGQHVLAHELVHVRQQTGGAVSMLPQEGLELEIDPDPRLEREAEETAQRVMKDSELGIQGMRHSEVHVQRLTETTAIEALALFEKENAQGDIGGFREEQNARRIDFLQGALAEMEHREYVEEHLEELNRAQERLALAKQFEGDQQAPPALQNADDPTAAVDVETIKKEAQNIIEDKPSKTDLKSRKQELTFKIQDRIQQVALTDDQRAALDSGVDTSAYDEIAATTIKGLVSFISPEVAALVLTLDISWTWVADKFKTASGEPEERILEVRKEAKKKQNEIIEGEWTNDNTKF